MAHEQPDPSQEIPDGLTSAQVEALRREHGYNELPEHSEPTWKRLLKRFWGPIPWMIEVAAILSAVVQKWEDFTIICILLLVNVFIDFRQETKALSALEVLKDKLARSARVLRDGQWAVIPARELVPGDVVKVKLGDMVPADLRLVGPGFLQLDQSALTGESMAVSRTAGEEAYANSVVKLGEMVGVVTSIGPKTWFGRTVALVAKAEEEESSHFQQAVLRIGNFLIVVALVLVACVMTVSLIRHDPVIEILRFCLVLAVASVPVALPAVLSVTMAVGAMNLARRKAIVSRLVAIEELAGVDVLCTDKTGTLTQNRMALGEPWPAPGLSAIDVLEVAALASRRENNDPLETPIFAALEASEESDPFQSVTTLEYQPFDPITKRTEARVSVQGKELVVTKGAPQVIKALCNPETVPDDYDRQVSTLATKGHRALAVARRAPEDGAFTFVGILPFFDPPREDSAQTLQEARALGLKVQMITGDNVAIAREVARMLGIDGVIHRASELHRGHFMDVGTIARTIADAILSELRPDQDAAERQAALDRIEAQVTDALGSGTEFAAEGAAFVRRHESELIALIEGAAGFAEVMPEDKYTIIDKLQKNGHLVAMTGDGVNDAPALRKADAGIAVSGATDAARAAADLILTEPGLHVIIHAIEEARRIFGRMRSYTIFRIAETLRVILFMALAITVFNFYPVTAVMIIILALLNDIPIMAIAYDNAAVSSNPIRWNMREVLPVAVVLGVTGVASSFLLFFILQNLGLPQDLIQAIIFLKLDVAGHSTIYVTRAGPRHFWHRPFPSGKLLTAALGTRIAGTLIACYGLFMPAIGWKWVGIIYLYSTAWFVFNDFIKVWTYKALGIRAREATA
ncbi:MAG: HAD family hydrolase [Deltaproteobacteria bacterium]|nr:MAG: HAD family hydrolase [Deltaproteobacteria bacterium]